METAIIIPARKGSKGLPGKNRILLDHTISKIPTNLLKQTIVSTDDEKIVEMVQNKYPECPIHRRSPESASDTASIKYCLQEVVSEYSLRGDVIMLYLTYPKREWIEVEDAYNWYIKNDAKSLLCKEPTNTHPFLCMYELDNNKGKQIVKHDLYRRQHYPKCFKMCHMITIFNVEELKNLNRNLYNENTLYYKIPPSLDVDTPIDLEKLYH